MRCPDVRYDPEPIDVRNRKELREWFTRNHGSYSECWVYTKMKDTAEEGILYLDAVEEALCFGWIDSTKIRFNDRMCQRFSPRRRGSKWSELNKERCRRLEHLGLMTDAGRAVLPDLDEPFRMDDDVRDILMSDEDVVKNMTEMPALYVRIRIYNIQDVRGKDEFKRRLDRFIECTRKGVMYGEWNDGGRLIDYK